MLYDTCKVYYKTKTSQLTNEYTPSTNFMIFVVLTAVFLKTSVISCCAEGHIVKQSYNMALLGQIGHVYEGTMLLWNIGNYLPVDIVCNIPQYLNLLRTSSKWPFCFFVILLFSNKYNTLQFFTVRQGKWANTCNPTHAQLQERENQDPCCEIPVVQMSGLPSHNPFSLVIFIKKWHCKLTTQVH